MAVWARADLSYARRVRALRAGLLTAKTVLADGAVDIFVVGAGTDWFWAAEGEKTDAGEPRN
jgi:hypothetical protein